MRKIYETFGILIKESSLSKNHFMNVEYAFQGNNVRHFNRVGRYRGIT